MHNVKKSAFAATLFIVGFLVVSIVMQQDEMIWYRLSHFARQSVLGKHTSNRLYHEELRRKSRESFRNNPHRDEFLKAHPGFLDANPNLR